MFQQQQPSRKGLPAYGEDRSCLEPELQKVELLVAVLGELLQEEALRLAGQLPQNPKCNS